jgi:hypothetical protein
MIKEPELKRVVERFLWLPTRDSQTRRWLWLRRVFVVERRVIGNAVLGWGIGVIPYFKWERVSVGGRP